jgi:alcohol dehydrogenase (quinone), cytochrome c subunit
LFWCVALSLCLSVAKDAASSPPAPALDEKAAQIESGRYLAAAGNCISCHTREGGESFTGGLAFETPFGTIYSTNITPDSKTGIGNWSLEDFREAMHEGVAPGGNRLFPAFPYTSFTKVTDKDVAAIFAYLRTLKAVLYRAPDNSFLLRARWGLALWNGVFFTEKRFAPFAGQTPEWKRGAYLVEGLGHCSACHSPRNVFMSERADRPYEGGILQDKVAPGVVRRWSAVNLTSAKSGLASWSVNDLTRYLQTGFSLRAGTFGPMNEVIINSVKNLKPEDVHAMAVYLKSIPARQYSGGGVPSEEVSAGASIYKERCEKCHSASGRGGVFSGPPLAGSAIAQAEDPASLINIIVYGPGKSKGVSLGAWESMPAYGSVLDDAQIAAVSNYIRGSWGNRAPAVSRGDVTQQR